MAAANIVWLQGPGMRGRTLGLKQKKETPLSHSKEQHTKQSSLVFLTVRKTHYTLLVGRPHEGRTSMKSWAAPKSATECFTRAEEMELHVYQSIAPATISNPIQDRPSV
jgi:hypothetical protein